MKLYPLKWEDSEHNPYSYGKIKGGQYIFSVERKNTREGSKFVLRSHALQTNVFRVHRGSNVKILGEFPRLSEAKSMAEDLYEIFVSNFSTQV